MNKVVKITNVNCLLPLIESWKDEAIKSFNIDFDISQNIQHLNDMADNPNSVILGLMVNDKVVGYIGLCLFNNPLGKGIMANEHFWYVLPEHRGIGALRLLEAGREWAESRGCTHFIANASKLASNLHDKVCAIYEKFGMSHFETTYICEVN